MYLSFLKISLIVLVFGVATSCIDKEPSRELSKWAISSYNFGGMQEMEVGEQISLLRSSGYQGLILRVATPGNFEMLPVFLKEAKRFDDFKVHAAFVRYNFEDTVMRERWVEVVDQIAFQGIQLWVIFGKDVGGYDETFIEDKLREINDYAAKKDVEVVLYPHSSTYYESVEQALPLVQKINSSNLFTALHLYHEIRAGNGHRVHEVLEYSIGKLGAVTLAGTDSVADYTSPLTRDTSTIKTIGSGSFDLKTFLATLHQLKYDGFVGVMNFKISADPKVYLPKSKNKLDDYMEEIQSKL